ncbi:MAG: FHA domain-containing protein [Candidatus Eremiobacterota bacterium]
MKCSVCGSDNLDGSAYCEDCGARLPVGAAVAAGEGGGASPGPAVQPPPVSPLPAPPPQEAPDGGGATGTVVCASCGAENPGYEAYCEDCGASLSGSSSGTAGSSATSAAPPPLPTPTPPSAPRVRLTLADGSREYVVNKDTMEIGRKSPVDGIYPDVDLTDVDTESFISRRHGRLLRAEAGVLYEDLGSSNGSFLNDSRLQAGVQTSLKDGDRLRLGKTEMVFRAS